MLLLTYHPLVRRQARTNLLLLLVKLGDWTARLPGTWNRYWLRTQDADVERLLKVFTDLSMEKIAEIMATHSTAPEARTAQTLLADEATRLVRGEQGRRQAVLASRVLFGGESPADCLAKMTAAESREDNLSGGTAEDDLAEVFAGCDPVQLGREDVIGRDIFHTLKEAGLYYC